MSGPSLVQVNRRRWWIAVTSVIENLMFAAVLLGWSSLLLMLKNEGFYSNLYNTTSTNVTSSNETKTGLNQSMHDEDEIFFTPSGAPTCAAQDEILNRYFSIGSSLLSGVTVVLGVIMDKYGSRMIRLTGTLAFMVSCLLFAIGSLDTEQNSILIAPAVCLNGMGGVVYIFTSFPVPNLFAELRSTMISLMIGSYSASAVMYMLFKTAYDAGVPFVAIMGFHATVGFLTFLNCYFNCPGEPIPGPEDISYAIKLHFDAFRFEHKITGKSFLRHTSSVGRRMSSVDITPSDNHNYLTSIVDMSNGNKDSSEEPETFLQALMSPCILLSFVTMCLTQLRLIAYMGSLEVYLKSSADQLDLSPTETTETVDFYTFLFGLFQINCFFMAPVIGTIMDWKLTNKPKKTKKRAILESEEPEEKMNGHKRKHQQIMNLARAFMITNLLLCIFGIIIMFEKILPLQVVAFIIHTAVRTFLHSSIGGLYACMYHFSHFGKLTGLASFLSAMFILIQDPLFVLVNSQLGGDPFWINFTLLILSITGFGLPIYLWNYARKM
uniref:Major facilitator superfamily (MFS) profile domain-containing protein n=1 Tax=Ciona savignyi TaxID=51511 RepID=H2ZIL6_CIOSA